MARILLVEASQTQAEIYTRLLKEVGHSAEQARTTGDAVRICYASTPDLVIIDPSLAEESGMDVCRRIKGDMVLAFLPVLVLGDDETSQDETTALDAGADAFVSKAQPHDELLAVVEHLLAMVVSSQSDEPAGTTPRPELRRIRLLAVDDSPTIREVFAINLRASGFDVTGTASGAEALELLQQQEFDVGVFDIVMPGMDGYELCRRARAWSTETGQQLGIVVLSGQETKDVHVRALGAGADDYVMKSQDPTVVIAHIRSVARRVGMIRQIQLMSHRVQQQQIELLEADLHRDQAREQGQLVDQLKLTVAQLGREQYLLNALVDNIPDPVFFKDCDGRFIRVNQAMANHAGCDDPSQLIGKTDADFWSSEFAAKTRADEQVILETGQPLINKEERTVNKDGGASTLLVTKLPLRDEQGDIVGTFGVSRDISERKRIEEELERSNKELDEFAYVASHDLRSPLEGIKNLAKWIAEDNDDILPDASKRHLEQMQQRMDRLDLLLSDLLEYSRAGRVHGVIMEVDTANLVADMAAVLSPAAGFQISSHGDMPKLRTARTPLEQVLRNLIDNAVKHHDGEGGTVKVSCRDADEFYEFAVTDDGPGIAPEFHDQIFKLFETLKPRDEVEGSGMGLSVIRKIVESYGGKVTVESPGDRGTTFRFTWPKEMDA
jgi:PAS domain S-box-containing protein